MILYTPGVQVLEPFIVPDVDGSNVSGLTWTPSLYKDGVSVSSGVEFDSLSCEGVGSPETHYLVSFTPMTDGSEYKIVCVSDAGDAWEERLEQNDIEVGGAPSFASAVFKCHAYLLSGGKLVDCVSAVASLYQSGDQDTPVKSLGSGTEGTLNAFYWTGSSVSLTAGLNYFVRVTFTVAAPGSPATPVTISRDLSFST
jgi:hypothetical protein